MEKYVENLKEYLKGRRNISRKLYRFISTDYRAVQNNRITWDEAIQRIGGVREWKKI